MARTIVYSRKGVGSNANAAPAGGPENGGDNFAERLVKYVPAEVLSLFLPLVAIATGESELLWVLFGAGFLATFAYLFLSAERNQNQPKPLHHFYVLALVAFAAWALGTSADISGVVGVGPKVAALSLGLAAFLLPALDGVLEVLAKRWPPFGRLDGLTNTA